MSKWLMRGHFRHLHFNSFPMSWRILQGEVFWPLQSSSKVLGVSEDSQVPILEVWVSSSHFSKNGVVTSSVLCSFEHEQYPSNSVDPWCLIFEYLNDNIGFLVWLCNTLTSFKIYVLEPNVFLGYLTKDNACALSIHCHKQYLFDNLN
jgi:hypothetical protein